jgi:hypothetical protein
MVLFDGMSLILSLALLMAAGQSGPTNDPVEATASSITAILIRITLERSPTLLYFHVKNSCSAIIILKQSWRKVDIVPHLIDIDALWPAQFHHNSCHHLNDVTSAILH